jgi:hypothetical protein
LNHIIISHLVNGRCKKIEAKERVTNHDLERNIMRKKGKR